VHPSQRVQHSSDVSTRFSRRRVKVGLVWTGFAVSGFFAYLAVRDVDWSAVWNALTASNYWWAAPSLAFMAISIFVRAVRWQYLFSVESRPPLRPVLDATLIGYFFNNVLPARAGEAARVVALNRTARTSRAEATTTIVLERAYDVLGLLVLLFVLLPWFPDVGWVRPAVVLAAALGAILALAASLLVLFGDRPFRRVLRPLSRLPLLDIERTDRAAANVHRGTASLHRPRLALLAFTLTVLSWILFGLSAWALMQGFDLGVPALAAQLVIIALGLASILPSSPGAVGVFEAAVLVALRAYGVPKSEALSYALVFHAISFLLYVTAGAVVLHLHALALRRSLGSVGAPS
jgi:glycosyltransferase 2 family protein